MPDRFPIIAALCFINHASSYRLARNSAPLSTWAAGGASRGHVWPPVVHAQQQCSSLQLVKRIGLVGISSRQSTSLQAVSSRLFPHLEGEQPFDVFTYYTSRSISVPTFFRQLGDDKWTMRHINERGAVEHESSVSHVYSLFLKLFSL